MQPIPIALPAGLKEELEGLEGIFIEVNGRQMQPSQCYYFDTNPPHLLFNTHCPDFLKEKIQGILQKYYPTNKAS